MRIIVTGGAGFIGSHFINIWLVLIRWFTFDGIHFWMNCEIDIIKKMASRMIQSYKRILDDLNHLLSSLTLIEGNNVE